jgi:thiamine-monophosphate kinase
MDPALGVLGEFGLIGRIRARVGRRSSGMRLGIGDDAAILEAPPGHEVLVTTDMLLEDVHFKRSWGCLRELGRKSLAVNVSDIAAMGGSPHYAFLGLGLPFQGVTLAEVDAILAGLEDEAGSAGVTLAGGDTCGSRSGLVLSVTLVGSVPVGHAIRRSGARPGDGIWVTGSLGGSSAGLLALERGLRPQAAWPAELDRPSWLGPADEAALREGVAAHLTPTPRLAVGQALRGCATSMIDLSDGLASDIGHVCAESGVGAHVQADLVPLHPGARVAARWTGRNVLDLALRGGEDYELLFTCPADPCPRLAVAAPGLRVTRIGEVADALPVPVLEWADGRSEVLAGGFDHLRGAT